MFPVDGKLLLLFIRDKIKSLKELQKISFINLSREFSRESDTDRF